MLGENLAKEAEAESILKFMIPVTQRIPVTIKDKAEIDNLL